MRYDYRVIKNLEDEIYGQITTAIIENKFGVSIRTAQRYLKRYKEESETGILTLERETKGAGASIKITYRDGYSYPKLKEQFCKRKGKLTKHDVATAFNQSERTAQEWINKFNDDFEKDRQVIEKYLDFISQYDP